MEKKVIAILTAAGTGSRFSVKNSYDALPKQFLKLNGKPVILYSLLAFQKCSKVNEIIVTANRTYFDFIHNIAIKNGIGKLTMLVEGGKTRFGSVKNAFKQITCKPNDLVLIHDAARPNVSVKLIKQLIEASLKYGEVIPAVRIGDTLKLVEGNLVKETIDRNNLRAVQTPQVFRHKILKSAYNRAGRKNDFTDEASLAEKAGFRVRIINGEKNNIKITTRDEIVMLKKIM